MKKKKEKSSAGLFKGLIALLLVLWGLNKLLYPTPLTINDVQWQISGRECFVSFAVQNETDSTVNALVEITPYRVPGNSKSAAEQKGFTTMDISIDGQSQKLFSKKVLLSGMGVNRVDVIPCIRK